MKVGRVAESIYNRSVRRWLTPNEGMPAIYMNTMTYQSRDLGYWAVHRGLNTLYANGLNPVGIEASVLLPVQEDESDLRKAVSLMRQTCEEENVALFDVNVTVTPAVSHMMISITAIGNNEQMESNSNRILSIGKEQFKAGQDLVVTNWIGLEGTSIIATEKEDELCRHFSTQYVEGGSAYRTYASISKASRIANEEGVHARHEVSDGGIFGALWQLASASGVGLEIYMKDLPMKQETVELCEYYDLNPYELASSGCLLLGSNNGIQLVHRLAQEGIEAVVIGKATSGNDRVLLNAGERRFIVPTKADQLFQVVS